MLRALDEAGIRPDLVLGTSIGAFNGSVVSDHPGSEGVARLTDLWAEIAQSDVLRGSSFERFKKAVAFKPALHDTTEMRSLLEHVHQPDRRIEELAITFQCVAASIERAAEHWFTSGPLIEALLASSRALSSWRLSRGRFTSRAWSARFLDSSPQPSKVSARLAVVRMRIWLRPF